LSCFCFPPDVSVTHILIHASDLNSPLHLAVQEGKSAVVKLLLEHGVSVLTRYKCSWTPLNHASSRDYPDIIRLLLEGGANVDVQDDGDSTPLHVAVVKGHVDVIKILIEYGANPHARNRRRQTAFQASEMGSPQMIRLLSPGE